jgi:DNA-binding winged helix-turn-helix (wHTH) protein
MSHQDRRIYEFGPFRLDPRERRLTSSGIAISITPKAFDTLCALVENGGQIMEKDCLLKRVWPDTFVEEATLAQNIFTLRKVLGTDSEGDVYIETVPRRGYRFVAPVHVRTLPLSETNRRGTSTEIASAAEETVAQSVAEAAVSTRSIASPQGLLDIPVEAELVHEKYPRPENVAGHVPHAETIGPPKPRRIWTWALPTAALLFVVGLVRVFFQTHPVQALGRNDVIVLAEFTNTTGEPVFDGTLKEALTIDLEQTPFLNVLSDLKVAHTLKLMQRAISDPITPNVAREI